MNRVTRRKEQRGQNIATLFVIGLGITIMVVGFILKH